MRSMKSMNAIGKNFIYLSLIGLIQKTLRLKLPRKFLCLYGLGEMKSNSIRHCQGIFMLRHATRSYITSKAAS